jgi:predicted aspartyl protease
MSSRRFYSLQRSGNLLWLKAAVRSSSSDPRIIRLLVDTGSSYTVLPTAILQEIGCRPSDALQQITMMAAGGIVQSPIVIVPEFQCLGRSLKNFRAVALNLPFNPLVNGLLGMDFLQACKAIIDLEKSRITVAQA